MTLVNIDALVRVAVDVLGVRVASVGALVLLFGLFVSAAKLNKLMWVGSKTASAGSRVSSTVDYLKWGSLALAILTLGGIVSVHPTVAEQYLAMLPWEMLPSVDEVARLVGGML